MTCASPYMVLCSALLTLALLKALKRAGKIAAIKKKRFSDLLLYIMLFSLSVIHPAVSRTIFDVFNCQQVFGYDSPWLKADLDLQCLTSTWWPLAAVALFVFMTYVVGFPVGVLLLLRKRNVARLRAGNALRGLDYLEASPEQVNLFLKTIHKWDQLRFLHGDYTRNLFFWEVLEMIRKLLLSSVLLAVAEYIRGFDTMFGLLVLMMFSNIHMLNWPYSEARNNWLKVGELVAETISVFCILLLATRGNLVDSSSLGVFVTMIQILCIIGGFVTFCLCWRAAKADIADTLRRQRLQGAWNQYVMTLKAIDENKDVLDQGTRARRAKRRMSLVDTAGANLHSPVRKTRTPEQQAQLQVAIERVAAQSSPVSIYSVALASILVQRRRRRSSLTAVLEMKPLGFHGQGGGGVEPGWVVAAREDLRHEVPLSSWNETPQATIKGFVRPQPQELGFVRALDDDKPFAAVTWHLDDELMPESLSEPPGTVSTHPFVSELALDLSHTHDPLDRVINAPTLQDARYVVEAPAAPGPLGFDGVMPLAPASTPSLPPLGFHAPVSPTPLSVAARPVLMVEEETEAGTLGLI
eukprot:CAMPEP_0175912910 /NCGR_PEP_ID=MMETSP0108-20121206/8982_1 /TAXON_ID=195067 ORGANISM="Goniomonas pacifica, Strain CCMP1869" /NCGR_SAMPLE_ID=MMETSP0108 /ASSEMBLY_ACC=CAM_ASM_000204 /LENGTH=580 /DNA_ID=CAMNT_0017235261 /DNA_START=57 /DNA_END=1799 /DNA_ORIENTATION=+